MCWPAKIVRGWWWGFGMAKIVNAFGNFVFVKQNINKILSILFIKFVNCTFALVFTNVPRSLISFWKTLHIYDNNNISVIIHVDKTFQTDIQSEIQPFKAIITMQVWPWLFQIVWSEILPLTRFQIKGGRSVCRRDIFMFQVKV